jgi:sulfatase maturation enzyme AslB (radical SAM superfamily)
MSFDVAKTIIDNLLSNDDVYNTSHVNAIVLEFIGGEPFLEVILIQKIVDYFINKCTELNHRFLKYFMISISSNGLLYFSEEVQSFIKKYNTNLSLSISIDGNKELHDACRLDLKG